MTSFAGPSYNCNNLELWLKSGDIQIPFLTLGRKLFFVFFNFSVLYSMDLL